MIVRSSSSRMAFEDVLARPAGNPLGRLVPIDDPPIGVGHVDPVAERIEDHRGVDVPEVFHVRPPVVLSPRADP